MPRIGFVKKWERNGWSEKQRTEYFRLFWSG